MNLPFVKYSGCGNDFVVFESSALPCDLDAETISRWCDRHEGVGADGLLSVKTQQRGAVSVKYWNSDGSEASLCGNGLRCAAHFATCFLHLEKTMILQTPCGALQGAVTGNEVTISMPHPTAPELLQLPSLPPLYSLWTGVPHAVLFIDSIATAPVATLGPRIRNHPHFGAEGTNVTFAERTGNSEYAIRTFERGVEEETLACGTGAVAVAITAAIHLGVSPPITILPASKSPLVVTFSCSEEAISEVFLTGDARPIFSGTLLSAKNTSLACGEVIQSPILKGISSKKQCDPSSTG